MRPGICPLAAFTLSAGLLLPACTSGPQPERTAFFPVAQPEAEAVRVLAREQDRQVQSCTATHSCHRAHYVRALAALYEDRRLAVQHFQAAISDAPSGPYAASSRAWIRLLDDGRASSDGGSGLIQAIERVVREVVEREAGARLGAARRVDPRTAQVGDRDLQSVQALKRQLKEREKKIDELTQQIEALMRVDQEVKDRIRPDRSAD